ncbi:MAG: copper chaperone PCu(A)C [Pseudomonadota bacterium]
MKSQFFAVAIAATFSASAIHAHDYKVGDLVVDHPMTFATAQSAMAAGGFMTITNNGETADRLVSVNADFPRVEIHTTEVDGDIARMMELEDGIEIPAGETVMLQPGGLHVMFMGLNGDPFEVGEEVGATLVFENAGEVEVMFKVEERKGHGMDHGAHDHSGHNHDS